MNNDIILTENEEKRFGILLVSLYFNSSEQIPAEKSLKELKSLAKTSMGEDSEKCDYYFSTQCKSSPEAATYIGKGKLAEIALFCKNNDIFLVVFDAELSPAQIRNIEDEISKESPETKTRVIDRTMLILDIFAKYAVTGEGKLQVEIAQLHYTSPRLTGRGTELSRQGGSSSGSVGARGPGETKLETDKRHIKRRIAYLEQQIKELESNRSIQRSKRQKSKIPVVAIVGYTNAGKSTLLNYLTNADILCEDKLFATLDPTVRKLELPSGFEILLTDTVGFINKLPHVLIKAFKSTLEEANYADMLLILVDADDEDCQMKISVTEEILSELGAMGKPVIYVFNKCDKLSEKPIFAPENQKKTVCISARTGEGVDNLLCEIEKTLTDTLKKVTFLFPFDVQSPLNNLYKNSTVLDVEYTDEGTKVQVLADEKIRGMYKEYLI